MAPPIFERIFRKFTAGIQTWLWDYVVMRNQFSLAGGKQLATDISEFWNIFARYVGDPEVLTKKLKAACILLTLEDGNEGRTGFKEVVQALFEDNEHARGMLEELNLAKSISTNEARAVLQRRVEAWS